MCTYETLIVCIYFQLCDAEWIMFTSYGSYTNKDTQLKNIHTLAIQTNEHIYKDCEFNLFLIF